MKPKIIHILNSQSMGWSGGITATLTSLARSSLQEKFTLELLSLEEAKNNLTKQDKQIIIIHRAASWQNLRDLLTLKKFGKVFLQDNHYSQGFERFQVPVKFRFRTMLRLAYGLVDGVITVSEGQKNWIVNNHLAPAHKVKIINFSRLLDNFYSLPQKPRNSSTFILGAYGRFSEQKGFDVLLKALKLIPQKNIQLYLGGTGAEEIKLKQLVDGQSNIHFLGKIDDVPNFLNRCDAIAIPSRWEPWGNVCLEAKAAGKPIIASDIDGLSEQVKDCGLLVPPDNPQALAEAIQLLEKIPEANLIELGKQARNSVINAWNIYINRWEKLLSEALN